MTERIGVHRRGLVDKWYLESTGDHRNIGEKLALAPQELLGHLSAVVEAAAALSSATTSEGSFALVWREQLKFDASAGAIEAGLRPFLKREAKASEWPGSTLVRHLAIVRFYRLARESIAILASAQRMYAWVAPERRSD